MLSTRGQANADQLDIPWRFLPGGTPYDADKHPEGLISFATAENALVQGELEEFAAKVHIPRDAFRYAYCTAGGPRLPRAFAVHVNEYFAPYREIPASDVKITASATALHDILAFSLAAPGEGILTSTPYYGRFEIDFGNKAHIHLVPAQVEHQRCFDADVVQAFEKALGESEKNGVKIRALLIVNPHNPLGRCYPRSTLLALMHFCARHTIHLISDEIYALSVFPTPLSPSAVPFTSLLSLDPTGIIDANLVHVTYGLSKDFGAAGLKVGALISRNEALKKAVHAVLRFHGVSGPSVAVATAMLEDRDWVRGFIALSRQRIADAYLYFTTRLAEIGIRYYEGGNAGFFLWIDMSPFLPLGAPGAAALTDAQKEIGLAERLLRSGLVLQPGEEHGVAVGWFRVVFTMERGVVEEGLRRLEGVVKEIVGRW
ncbi:pyridoxal phosphate-dependent transferase [Pyrenochaeta sp. MPI-SDFR-AT-0127]|nr:pyridoxal phosphate-dependent transferase [Pyrenochaeta sp. MPI-SDFR-AT-0127]